MKKGSIKVFLFFLGIGCLLGSFSRISRAEVTQFDLGKYALEHICMVPVIKDPTESCKQTKDACLQEFVDKESDLGAYCSLKADGNITCNPVIYSDGNLYDNQQSFDFRASNVKNKYAGPITANCPTVCGDGVVGGDEICDGTQRKPNGGGGINLPLSSAEKCVANCTAISTCGNGVKEEGETCDEGQPSSGGHNGQLNHCNMTCDGMVGAAPFAQPGNSPNQQAPVTLTFGQFPQGGPLVQNPSGQPGGNLPPPPGDVDPVCYKFGSQDCVNKKSNCQGSGQNCEEAFNACLADKQDFCKVGPVKGVHDNSGTQEEETVGNSLPAVNDVFAGTPSLGNKGKFLGLSGGCSFLPGSESVGGLGMGTVILFGFAPLVARRFKKAK